jgi:hypothetical protein
MLLITTILLQILLTTTASPLPSHNINKPQTKRDNPWSVYLCTIANWSEPSSCIYNRGKQGECINLDLSSLNTIRGFGPDRNQTCRLYNPPDCAQDADDFESLDLRWPGDSDLRNNGWAYKLMSWRCVAPGTEPVP